MNDDAINRIGRYVAAGCPVRTESLLSDAHVFWWDTCDGEEADFAIVNRNGNIARAIQQNGTWRLYKGVGKNGFSPFSPASWEFTSVSGPDLRACAQKMWLPSRDEERLTFLPKDLTPPGRRKVIVRDQLVTFVGLKSEGFALELGGVRSPDFQGKPWESQAAVDWCVARCRDGDAPKSAEQILAHAQVEQAVFAMEDLPGFGMF